MAYNVPLESKLFLLISKPNRIIPAPNPLTRAVNAPVAFILLQNSPRRKTEAIGGAMYA